jgi:hypothetical protein
VAGALAALRWWRRRRSPVLPAAEATVIVRRAALGVLAGIATMVSLGVMAIANRHDVPSSWMWFAVVGAGLGAVALIAALPAVWAAARLRPVTVGPAGDVFDDLGGLVPARLRGRPWRLALIIAAGVVLLITLAAVPA